MFLIQDPTDPLHSNENTQESEERDEEALSLCDLPIEKGREFEDATCNEIRHHHHHTTPDQDLFEFFNDLNTEMCAAEDIFLSGKLLPFKSSVTNTRNEVEERSFFHIRSESLNETISSRPKYRVMRSSFSVDYGKREKVSSSIQKQTQMANRVPSRNHYGTGDISGMRVSSRPKWYLLMFGSMRAPVVMEMKDIRSRQRRRQPPPASPSSALEGGERAVSGGKEEEGKSPWKLLRVLSCKGHANAVVTASFGCITPVRSL